MSRCGGPKSSIRDLGHHFETVLVLEKLKEHYRSIPKQSLQYIEIYLSLLYRSLKDSFFCLTEGLEIAKDRACNVSPKWRGV